MLSLLDKLWASHLVKETPSEPDLLYIDRHLVHEVTSNQAFESLRTQNRPLRRPDLTCAVIDHSLPTDERTRPLKDTVAEAQLAALEKNQAEFGVKVFFGDTDPCQGVIHVTMPEQGLILPGHSVVCGDSHTATHGAFGALAFGIGTSEVEHVMATQTILQTKPKNMLISIQGTLPATVSAKDLILYIINQLGVSGGTGYALEYQGQVISSLSMDSRMTVTNMSIECGAKLGLIAPDEITFNYLKDKPYAPKNEDFQKAIEVWKNLKTDPGYQYNKILELDVNSLTPRVTWGTNPAQNIPISSKIPRLESFKTPEESLAARNALAYQKLTPGTKMSDVTVDYVFIGSCTNGRYEDLKIAAEIFRHYKVKKGVTVLIVPGSRLIKKQAESEKLDRIFLNAGCQWRDSGCSMCLGMNPDLVPPGNRCVSTSNRNFEGRQGRGALTHLASPATAAASAVSGRIVSKSSLKRFM
ncbi:MAG: 3-isopropylmalate dehydratase large subunit [Deltaproteobacteria bacterium]|jgi:3-isopropylmalate/(R)-2-methylmalate dehydratase large subunit|nr:3-isopropylmalate dehydratase large subunit [Deltaproteobacteria bacterium]